MSTKLEEFKKIIRQMFQFDQADLDFGIYRIMNQKRAEVERFLDQDLLPNVKKAFGNYEAQDKARLQEELAQLRKQLEDLGVDPETSPKYVEKKNQLEQAPDVVALENEVYSHLTNFFRRYYHEGDFLSLRRYKKDVYAIPYEGEEVKLYWANADQYYVKTSEYLRDYLFTLPSGRRVHFKLVEASTEQNNNKAPNGKERRFVLDEEQPVVEENGELYIRFHFILQEKKVKQGELNAKALAVVFKNPIVTARWQELATPMPTEKYKTRTLLEKHLNDYTAKNTFDYFIHKDLGGFLRRELDFYIKNEVMFLDDLGTPKEMKLEQYIAKIRAIKEVGHKIIKFLEQLENFQKKLWLKKKFVVETNYCITLDRVPEEFYPEIAGNSKQVAEWVKLFAINELVADGDKPGYSEPLTVEFLKANPYLVLDTAFFGQEFKEKLLASIENLEEQVDGLLVHSENFQALNLLQERYREQIQCIYIDPNYNRGDDGFLYKDSYKDSSWLSMINDRIKISKRLLKQGGVFFSSIDEHEQARLELLLLEMSGLDYITTFIWEGGRKNDSKLVSISHEYMLCFLKDKEFVMASNIQWRVRKDGINDIYKKADSLKRELGDNYKEMSLLLKEWYDGLPDNHPSKRHKHYNCIDRRGVYFPSDISWPGGGGPKYEVIHPVTGKPCKLPARGWKYPTYERMQEAIENDLVHFGEDETSVPCSKSYLKDNEEQAPNSVFYKDGRAAMKRLRHIMGSDVFDNPKDEDIIAERIKFSTQQYDIILDYFAGSGTTGHSVINLNREDKEKGVDARRKYILVEMGEYFDTVLKPRIQKVIYSKDWKDGKPVSREGISHMFKYIRLESYEDTMNNLELKRPPEHDSLFAQHKELREEYILSYMLDMETNGSASLLNLDYFQDPFNYKLKITRNQETREEIIDLVETFNYLLGLRVQHIEARETFNAVPDESAAKPGTVKLRIDKNGQGEFTFKIVTGLNPAGERVLIIWRNLTGDIARDNAALNAYFTRKGYNTRDNEFDRIYVNGDNNLANLAVDEGNQWKVLLIEEEFKRLMFDVQDV